MHAERVEADRRVESDRRRMKLRGMMMVAERKGERETGMCRSSVLEWGISNGHDGRFCYDSNT